MAFKQTTVPVLLSPHTLSILDPSPERLAIDDILTIYKLDSSLPDWSIKTFPKTFLLDLLASEKLFTAPEIEARLAAIDAAFPAKTKTAPFVKLNKLHINAIFGQRILSADADKKILDALIAEFFDLASSVRAKKLHGEIFTESAQYIGRIKKIKFFGSSWRNIGTTLTRADCEAAGVELILQLAQTHDFSRIPIVTQPIFLKIAQDKIDFYGYNSGIFCESNSEISAYRRPRNRAQRGRDVDFVPGEQIIFEYECGTKITVFDAIADPAPSPEEIVIESTEAAAALLKYRDGHFENHLYSPSKFKKLVDAAEILYFTTQTNAAKIAYTTLKREYNADVLRREIYTLTINLSELSESEIAQRHAEFTTRAEKLGENLPLKRALIRLNKKIKGEK